MFSEFFVIGCIICWNDVLCIFIKLKCCIFLWDSVICSCIWIVKYIWFYFIVVIFGEFSEIFDIDSVVDFMSIEDFYIIKVNCYLIDNIEFIIYNINVVSCSIICVIYFGNF